MKGNKRIPIIIGVILILIVASNIYVLINNKQKEEAFYSEPITERQTVEYLSIIKQDIQFTEKNQIIELGPEVFVEDENKENIMHFSLSSSTTKAKLKVNLYVDDEIIRSFDFEPAAYDDSLSDSIPYDLSDRDKMDIKITLQYVDEKEVDFLDKYNVELRVYDIH